MKEILISQKYMLTITEAVLYFNIGEHRLRRLVEDSKGADWIFRNGNRTMIKREKFEKVLDKIDTI